MVVKKTKKVEESVKKPVKKKGFFSFLKFSKK